MPPLTLTRVLFQNSLIHHCFSLCCEATFSASRKFKLSSLLKIKERYSNDILSSSPHCSFSKQTDINILMQNFLNVKFILSNFIKNATRFLRNVDSGIPQVAIAD